MVTRLLLLALLLHSTQAWKIHTSPPAEQLAIRRSGDNLMVVCNSDGAEASQYGNVDVDWYKEGQDQPVGKIGRIMTIAKDRSASKQLMFVKPNVDDSGAYKCVIKTPDGSSFEKTVNISFIEAAVFVNVDRNQHPEDGKDAEIVCRVKGHPSREIFWQFNKNNIIEGGPRGYEFKENNQVLVIPKFDSDNDDGEYACSVAQFSSFETVTINVSAYARPEITVFEGPASNRGNEGQSVQIQCQAVGKPKPEYKWTKNTEGTEEAIEPSDKYSVNGGLLVIHSLIPADAGSYKCVAWNSLDKSEHELVLSVFRKPRIEKMEDMARSIGESVEFSCRYAGDGTVKAKWVYQGDELFAPTPCSGEPDEGCTEGTEDNSTSEGTSAPPSESTTVLEGETTEEANEDEGTETTESEVTDEGEEQVDREKRQKPNVSVRKDGDALILRINSVAEDDAGEYLCVAENEAGSDRRTAFLAITHAPTITGYSNRHRATYYGTVELYCEASAVPDPTWTWTGPRGIIEANGVDYLIDSLSASSKLTITRAGDEDFGKFSCSADNGIGSASKGIEVIEIKAPEVPLEISCHAHVYPNYGTCLVDSYKDSDERYMPTHLIFYFVKDIDVHPDFEWEAEATNVTLSFSNDMYRIDGLQPKSRYSVRAVAINEAGSSEMSDVDFIETTFPWAPEKLSDVQYDCSQTCTLSWEKPNDLGSPITSYRVIVRELVKENPKEYVDEGYELKLGPDVSNMDLPSLEPLTSYEISLIAVNDVGNSSAYALVLKTSEFSGVDREVVSLSSLRIMLAAGFVLLFVLMVIDLICFATNRCGLLACFCINCLGRNVLAGKGKDVEHGNKSESNRLLSEGKAEAGISGRSEKSVGPQSTSV